MTALQDDMSVFIRGAFHLVSFSLFGSFRPSLCGLLPRLCYLRVVRTPEVFRKRLVGLTDANDKGPRRIIPTGGADSLSKGLSFHFSFRFGWLCF